MKQHMTYNEHRTRYLLKTDLQKEATFYAFSLKFSGNLNFKLFLIWFRKVLDSKTIQQNVRNGHIYIQLIKQHNMT